MENNKNKKSVKFQGDMLNFCDFIQVFVFTPNHHLNSGDFCSKWVQSILCLIHNKGSEDDPDNFRRISLINIKNNFVSNISIN